MREPCLTISPIMFLHPVVLPVLLVPTGGDADGWETVLHEAEDHWASLRPEQLPHDQQVHYSLRRGLTVRKVEVWGRKQNKTKKRIKILRYGWLNEESAQSCHIYIMIWRRRQLLTDVLLETGPDWGGIPFILELWTHAIMDD